MAFILLLNPEAVAFEELLHGRLWSGRKWGCFPNASQIFETKQRIRLKASLLVKFSLLFYCSKPAIILSNWSTLLLPKYTRYLIDHFLNHWFALFDLERLWSYQIWNLIHKMGSLPELDTCWRSTACMLLPSFLSLVKFGVQYSSYYYCSVISISCAYVLIFLKFCIFLHFFKILHYFTSFAEVSVCTCLFAIFQHSLLQLYPFWLWTISLSLHCQSDAWGPRCMSGNAKEWDSPKCIPDEMGSCMLLSSRADFRVGSWHTFLVSATVSHWTT